VLLWLRGLIFTDLVPVVINRRSARSRLGAREIDPRKTPQRLLIAISCCEIPTPPKLQIKSVHARLQGVDEVGNSHGGIVVILFRCPNLLRLANPNRE
jgi:hypothetical protein